MHNAALDGSGKLSGADKEAGEVVRENPESLH